MPYFDRLDESTYSPTEHVSGGWNPQEQHVAPGFGLLVHLVEADRDRRRDDGLVLSRMCFDVLGVLPMSAVSAQVRVVRPGRTVELVEAVLSHGGRPAVVVLRAWLLPPGDTSAVAGTSAAPLPPPDTFEPWDATTLWPGGFIASAAVRRRLDHPGRGAFWATTDVPLLEEPVSTTARAAAMVDIANGMVPRTAPEDVHYPNLDLTLHIFRQPGAGWLGFDTTASWGPGGLGLTSSVLHDEQGPIGTVNQTLTVRPRT